MFTSYAILDPSGSLRRRCGNQDSLCQLEPMPGSPTACEAPPSPQRDMVLWCHHDEASNAFEEHGWPMRGSWLSEWSKDYIFCLRIGADAGESLVSMKLRNAEATAPGYSWNIGPRGPNRFYQNQREHCIPPHVTKPRRSSVLWGNPSFIKATSSKYWYIWRESIKKTENCHPNSQIVSSNVFHCFVIEPDRHHKKRHDVFAKLQFWRFGPAPGR